MSGTTPGPLTPPSSQYYDGALSDAERADVLRFCWYPSAGNGNTGFEEWRFFQQFGQIQFRMTNAAPAEFQVIRQYLTQLYSLESAIIGASPQLNVGTAASFICNPREMVERNVLFDGWRSRLCEFFGVPPGPMRTGDMNSMRLVV